MATMDVFNQNAFSMISLTTAVNQQPFLPTFLGDIGIFTARPIRTVAAAIEDRNGTLSLIQTSQRGAPLTEGKADKRNIRYFNTARLAKGDTIFAHEIQNVRAFGSETELQQVSTEVAYRYSKLQNDVALTHENMRLGAVQGIVLDADGSTIYNWFTEWGVSQPSEVDWDLDNATPASGAVRQLCNSTLRTVQRALSGMWIPGRSYLLGLCGDNYWDNLTQHPEILKTYLNTQQASELRGDKMPFETFNYGGITWVNYRGTDDGTTVAVGSDKVKFVPVGVPGLFETAFAPAESFDYVNTPGLPVYAMLVTDRDRNAWVRPELYSYPLFYCTRPAALLRGKRT